MYAHTDGGMDRPLFGEARPRDRYLNYFIGSATVLLVCVTLISSLVFPHFPPQAINVFLSFVIALICISELTLVIKMSFPKVQQTQSDLNKYILLSKMLEGLSIRIYWYRQGDVDPKFRKMIYFNSLTTILLCICANVYFHKHLPHCKETESKN